MNCLELCQDLAREAGMPAISSVLNQSGEALRAVNWINKAYRYIINLNPTWRFLRTEFLIQVQAGNASYSATSLSLTQFGEWKPDSFRAYAKSVGVADEQLVPWMQDYDRFRDKYQLGALRTMTGRPQIIVEKPDQSLIIWPTPDQEYVMPGEYYKFPGALAANADIPVLPAKFHEAIVWRALMYYGEYEGAGAVVAVGQSEFERVLSAMELLNLPGMTAEGTLA